MGTDPLDVHVVAAMVEVGVTLQVKPVVVNVPSPVPRVNVAVGVVPVNPRVMTPVSPVTVMGLVIVSWSPLLNKVDPALDALTKKFQFAVVVNVAALLPPTYMPRVCDVGPAT